MALAPVALAACSSQSAAKGATSTATAIPTPLATSIETGGGTWATVPMGHLDQPLNTFWQLFFQAKGSSSFSDEVEATAAATNGGLVLGSGGGRSVVVGVRPTDKLHFSPLIATVNAGRSWSNGVLTAGLSARPDSLATSPSGQVLALVTGQRGPEVLESTGGLASWQRLADEGGLSSGQGRACDPVAIEAVAFMSGDALVGTACSRAGVAGLFERNSDTWRLAGPSLPPAIHAGFVEVLGLKAAASGLTALFGISTHGRVALVAAWKGDGAQHWSVSGALQLASTERLTSFGPASGGGTFVLLSEPSGSERLEVVAGANRVWRVLPAPPSGTATVAVGPKGTLEALVVDQAVLSVWSLRPSSRGWTKGRVTNVPISYGSSG